MPVEDSKSRVTIFDKTGKSAITAVVITELFSVLEELDVVREPPKAKSNLRKKKVLE